MDKRKRNIIITVCVILGVIGIILIAIYASKSKKGKTYPTQGPSGTPVPTGSTIPTPVPSGSTTPTPVPTGSTTPTPVPSGTTPTPVPTGSTSPPHLPYTTTLEQIYKMGMGGNGLDDDGYSDYSFRMDKDLDYLSSGGKYNNYSMTGTATMFEGNIQIACNDSEAAGVKFWTGDPKDPFRYIVMTSTGVEYQDKGGGLHGLALPYIDPGNAGQTLTGINVKDPSSKILWIRKNAQGRDFRMMKFEIIWETGGPFAYGTSQGWDDNVPDCIGDVDQQECHTLFGDDFPQTSKVSTYYSENGCCNNSDIWVPGQSQPILADYTQGTYLWGTLDAWYISDYTGFYIFGSNDPNLNCINPQWQCASPGQPCPSDYITRNLDISCHGDAQCC